MSLLLKSPLTVLVACVAVIGSVASAPTSPSYFISITATETTTVTSELPDTTFLTVLTITEGWGVLPPSDPEPPWPVNPPLPGPVTLDKRQSLTTQAVMAPTSSSSVTLSATTTAEDRDEIQDMTLSLPTSTASTSTTPTVFADSGIFGYPPASETVTTKYSTRTTLNFPVVPPHLPDGTKLRRSDIGVDTTALSAGKTISVPDIHGTSAGGSPVHTTEIAPPPQRVGHSHGEGPEQPPPTEQRASYTFDSFSNMVLTPAKVTSIPPRFYLYDAAEHLPTGLPALPRPQLEVEMSSIGSSDVSEETGYWPTTTVCTTCGPFFAEETVHYTWNNGETTLQTSTVSTCTAEPCTSQMPSPTRFSLHRPPSYRGNCTLPQSRESSSRLIWPTQVTTATRDDSTSCDAVDNIDLVMPSQTRAPTGKVFTSEVGSIRLPTQDHTIIGRPSDPTTHSPATPTSQVPFLPTYTFPGGASPGFTSSKITKSGKGTFITQVVTLETSDRRTPA